MAQPLARRARKACARKGADKLRPRRWLAGRPCVYMRIYADVHEIDHIRVVCETSRRETEFFMPTDVSALQLVMSADPTLIAIVRLSLTVSLSAVLLAALIGLPIGAFLALARFPGREAVIIVLNGLMGLPPVVVGLVVYQLLSRSGPLGSWGLLLTPKDMVIAQLILVVSIIATQYHRSIEN